MKKISNLRNISGGASTENMLRAGVYMSMPLVMVVGAALMLQHRNSTQTHKDQEASDTTKILIALENIKLSIKENNELIKKVAEFSIPNS